MSNTPHGPGWWQASDGRWYPAETHPNHVPPPPAPASFVVPAGNVTGNKPWWRQWWAIALGVFIVLGIIGAIADSGQDDGENADDELAIAAAETATTAVSGASPTAPSADPVATTGLAPTMPPTTLPPTTTVPPTTVPPPPPPGSRENPVPLGQPINVTFETLGDADGSVWTITVAGSGSDLTQAVLDENMFNSPPDEGEVYYGVPITMTLVSAGKEPLSPALNIELALFGRSSLGIHDELSMVVVPNEFDDYQQVFVGGSISGNFVTAVPVDDVSAGVLLTTDSVTGDRVFWPDFDGLGPDFEGRGAVSRCFVFGIGFRVAECRGDTCWTMFG